MYVLQTKHLLIIIILYCLYNWTSRNSLLMCIIFCCVIVPFEGCCPSAKNMMTSLLQLLAFEYSCFLKLISIFRGHIERRLSGKLRQSDCAATIFIQCGLFRTLPYIFWSSLYPGFCKSKRPS